MNQRQEAVLEMKYLYGMIMFVVSLWNLCKNMNFSILLTKLVSCILNGFPIESSNYLQREIQNETPPPLTQTYQTHSMLFIYSVSIY